MRFAFFGNMARLLIRKAAMVTNSIRDDGPDIGLYAQQSGPEGAPTVVLIHGLFGMGSNLGSLARALADRYRVHQLDLPNHGRSPWQEHMGFPELAQAVEAYLGEHAPGGAALVGHSLGGKTAMQLAMTAPELVTALVVADIAPVSYPSSHDRVFAAIEAVAAAKVVSRRDGRAIMDEYLEEEGVKQFLLLSLARGEDGVYRWRFNAEVLHREYARLREAPHGTPYPGPTCLVYGSESTYVDAAGLVAMAGYFPDLATVEIPDTGHWLHAEAPERFNAAVGDFLDARLGLAA
jgi:esterase